MRIYKSHLARAVNDQTGISAAQAIQVINAMTAAITRSLASGDQVRINGFGRFHIQTRQSRRGRHPRTGAAIQIPSRRSVGFTAFGRLKQWLNGRQAPSAEPAWLLERRAGDNRQALAKGRAVVRISGITVCEFTVRDISGNGTGIVAERDSAVLRNLHVGQVIEIHLLRTGDNRPPTIQRSRIAHITAMDRDGAYPDHVLVGLKVIDRL